VPLFSSYNYAATPSASYLAFDDPGDGTTASLTHQLCTKKAPVAATWTYWGGTSHIMVVRGVDKYALGSTTYRMVTIADPKPVCSGASAGGDTYSITYDAYKHTCILCGGHGVDYYDIHKL
jgi:hypothetical protein